MSSTDVPATGELRMIALSRIHVDEGFNPRREFDQTALERLAESIKSRGVLQPLVVTPNGGDDYRLVAGERRYRAAGLASLTEVPAIVRPVSDDTAGLDDALIENLQRENLDPVEQARGFAVLLKSGLTRKGVAERLQLPQKLVTERLRILELPEELHPQIADGTVPPSAVKTLAELAKAHPGMALTAVRTVTRQDVSPDDGATWSDLVRDPVEAIRYAGRDQDLPPDVFVAGGSYPLARFTLSEKAQKEAEKLAKLHSMEVQDLPVTFGRESLQEAVSLGAALLSNDQGYYGAFILGQDVADQLAGDSVSRMLKLARTQQRRQREWEASRKATSAGNGDGEPEQLTEEQLQEQRKAEREQAREAREAAQAFNDELGAAVWSSMSRVKVDERVVKILSAIDFDGELDKIAMRGARYGFPGWREQTTTASGKPKVDYIQYVETAGEKAREYLAAGKTVGDFGGRLVALAAMALYADEGAIAKSKGSFYELSFYGGKLCWSREVVSLLEQIAEERLPEHLTAARRAARKEREKQEREERRRQKAAEQAKKDLLARLPELPAEERWTALRAYSEEHDEGSWGERYRELAAAIRELEAQQAPAVPAGDDGAEAEGAELLEPSVDHAELDYSDDAEEVAV